MTRIERINTDFSAYGGTILIKIIKGFAEGKSLKSV